MNGALTPDAIRPNVSTMTVEVTTCCSLRCVGCVGTVGRESSAWQDRHMSAALFARVCGNLPTLDRLTLHGIGEPTLNPEYLRIVDIAARTGRFKVLWANTNALVRSADYYVRLVDAGLTHLAVSVDSLAQPVADRTRPGTDVQRLRRRLGELAALPIPVSITMVVSRFNLDDVPSTLDALNQIGTFTVRLQPFFDFGRSEGCLTPDDVSRVQGFASGEATQRWENLAIEPVLALSGAPRQALCDAPWRGPAVSVDGFLTPCCVMWDPAVLGFIDLRHVDVESAFAHPSVGLFLDAYLREAPGFCATCHMNTRPVSGEFSPLQRHPAA